MKWILVKDDLPPQGMKVLCWRRGDCWVAQRWQECWFPIPFVDSKFADYNPPEMWSYIRLPRGFDGKMKFSIEGGTLMDADELEKADTEVFLQIKNSMKNEIDSRKKS